MRYRLQWLPNALSASRGILAVPILVLAVQGQWVWGFWLLALALVTDFFDGLAAKKLNAISKMGGNIDRLSDFLLAFLGGLALALGADVFSLQWFWLIMPISLLIGYVKFLTPEKGQLNKVTSVFSVLLLFLAWFLIFLGFLAQAYGWHWWYLIPVVAVIVIASLLKKHRFRYWFAWLIERHRKITK